MAPVPRVKVFPLAKQRLLTTPCVGGRVFLQLQPPSAPLALRSVGGRAPRWHSHTGEGPQPTPTPFSYGPLAPSSASVTTLGS